MGFFNRLIDNQKKQNAQFCIGKARSMINRPSAPFESPDERKKEIIDLLDKAALHESTKKESCFLKAEMMLLYRNDRLRNYIDITSKSCGKNNINVALSCLEFVLSVESNNIAALCYKAACIGALGRYQEAIDIFDNILKDKPNNYEVLYRKAFLFKEMGKHQEYEELLKRAMNLGAELTDLPIGINVYLR
jgi:tetratricopeptide (TPR) repeat protein